MKNSALTQPTTPWGQRVALISAGLHATNVVGYWNCLKQCRGSVSFWCGSGSPDPATDPDPTPDPTPFFSDFKDTKKISYFFLITHRQATIFSRKNLIFLLKFSFKILFCKHYFSPLSA